MWSTAHNAQFLALGRNFVNYKFIYVKTIILVTLCINLGSLALLVNSQFKFENCTFESNFFWHDLQYGDKKFRIGCCIVHTFVFYPFFCPALYLYDMLLLYIVEQFIVFLWFIRVFFLVDYFTISCTITFVQPKYVILHINGTELTSFNAFH